MPFTIYFVLFNSHMDKCLDFITICIQQLCTCNFLLRYIYMVDIIRIFLLFRFPPFFILIYFIQTSVSRICCYIVKVFCMLLSITACVGYFNMVVRISAAVPLTMLDVLYPVFLIELILYQKICQFVRILVIVIAIRFVVYMLPCIFSRL